MSASCSDALAPTMCVPASRVGSSGAGRRSRGARQPKRGSTESAAVGAAVDQPLDVPAAEVEAGEPLDVGPDEEIAVAERVGALLEEELHQPVGDEQRGVAFERVARVLGGVDHDDAIRAFGPRHGHGDVGRESAVGEKPAVAPLGREEQRHRRARAHRLGQVARLHDDRLTVGEVGGHGAEGNRQGIEVSPRQQVAAEQGGVHQRVGLGLDDGGALERESPIALLPEHERLENAERARGERLVGAEERGERDDAGERIELAAAVAAGVERADHRRPCWSRRSGRA